ncbi:MAG TPA: hypothetical protein VHI93_05795, partial [Candidatus Thermoplasmatota archaeon]|nr:hypothetical protein [Candidatus Thermoplasmatota archaeon]
MKPPILLLAATLLLPLALPSAGAQAPAEALRLLEDSGADVRVSSVAGDQDPAGRWAAADLRALDVREAPDEVTFTLTVGSLAASPEAPMAESVQYAIAFRHADQAYRVSLYRNVFFGTPFAYGFLEAYNPARQAYQQVGPFQEVAQDVAANALSLAVDRSLLLDRDGNAPHPGVPITDWSATAAGNPAFGFRFRNACPAGQQACIGNPVPTARDAMPDQGNGTLELVPRFGVAQQG